MGFFDDALRQVLPQSEHGQPIASAIGAVLVEQIFGSQKASGSPATAPGGTGSLSDGLGGLLARMEQAGLGDVAKSWVGNGPNQPIDANGIGTVLGERAVVAIATRTGLDPAMLQAQLAKYLPAVIDRLTPQGRVPTRQDIAHLE